MDGISAPEPWLAAIAGVQHGVVSRTQLLERGFTKTQIDRRIRAGRLQRLHYGVYAVGHRVLTTEGRWMAAVLTAGPGAVLSHASAAAAWDLRRTSSRVSHVTIPTRAGRERRAGMRIHRRETMTPGEVTIHRGIPITTPARTLIDLSRTLSGRQLEHLVDLADQRGLVDFGELRRCASPSLRAVLSRYSSATTRSELEERFLTLCDDHGIPRPETNTRIEGIEVDFVWRDRRLIVEVDGYEFHRSPTAFERDRERDVKLQLAGWRVMRFTWRQLEDRAGWVAKAIGEGACGPQVSSPPWP
jgi:very-short-patch-repair endonuclease